MDLASLLHHHAGFLRRMYNECPGIRGVRGKSGDEGARIETAIMKREKKHLTREDIMHVVII